MASSGRALSRVVEGRLARVDLVALLLGHGIVGALLSIASEDSRSVEVLKRAALQRFALDYCRR
jgi:hypothetical protein